MLSSRSPDREQTGGSGTLSEKDPFWQKGDEKK
jgi:hypothetical protein